MTAPESSGLGHYRDRTDDDVAWKLDAACRGVDPALFYPERGDNVSASSPAKEVCRTCPVQAACLSYALDAVETMGIWGGVAEKERRRMRGRRRRAS